MKLLELPEETANQIAWLESEMCGTEFTRLVAEVNVLHGDGDIATIELSDSERVGVLQSGLQTLTPARFRQLLKSADSLLAVQRMVLTEGGAYWSQVSPAVGSVSPTLSKDGTVGYQESVIQETTIKELAKEKTNWLSHLGWASLGSLATAAVLLLIMRPYLNVPSPKVASVLEGSKPLIQESPSTASPAWGFAKFAQEKGSLDPADTPTREQYLQELATAAEGWFNKRPADAAGLSNRIGKFRMGCSAILLADHEPLSDLDQIWLKKRCQSWASAIDQHLAEIEAGESVEKVLADTDSTVAKIVGALKGRADTAGT